MFHATDYQYYPEEFPYPDGYKARYYNMNQTMSTVDIGNYLLSVRANKIHGVSEDMKTIGFSRSRLPRPGWMLRPVDEPLRMRHETKDPPTTVA